jgi:hypothetical protein
MNQRERQHNCWVEHQEREKLILSSTKPEKIEEGQCQKERQVGEKDLSKSKGKERDIGGRYE